MGMATLNTNATDTEAGGTEEDEVIGGRKSPLRRCIVTGTVASRDGMVRFVVAPDDTVVPDLDGSLPGRGLWVTADRTVLAKAVAKNLFAKAARRAVRVEAGLSDRVAGLLRQRCLDLLGLARRGGGAVSGFEKVRDALRAGKLAVLVEAADGAADGRGKVEALAHGLPVIDLFEASALGQALGRDIAVHAGLAPGRMAVRFLEESRRYAGLAGMGKDESELRSGPGRPGNGMKTS